MGGGGGETTLEELLQMDQLHWGQHLHGGKENGCALTYWGQ